MRDSKEKIPIKITKICIALYFLPIILFIVLDIVGSDTNEILKLLLLILFFILFFSYLLMMALAPFMQLILTIVAIKNRKWKLFFLHMFLTVIFFVISYFVYEWFTTISV